MKRLLFSVILLVSMFFPQFAMADTGKKGEIVSYASGVPVVVDNNVDVTYTGKTWKDATGQNKYEYVARISQAPIYNDDGSLVDCSWHGLEDAYVIVNNVFSAQVIGTYITTTYQGQSMSWNPIVVVGSKEYAAKGFPILLAVDPINSYYKNNTLEWDYGVCVRRVRVIEGLIQETWVFDKDPQGTVWIKDNAQKSAGFEWAIAPYAFDANNNPIPINEYKQVSEKDLASAVYPVTIDPTEVYVTSASDGYCYVNNAAYASAWASGGSGKDDTGITSVAGQDWISGSGYVIRRAFVYFDTSAIPDSAVISAVNLSLYVTSVTTATQTYNLTVQNGMPTYPSDPLAIADLNKAYYSGDGGNKTSASITASAFNNIILNTSGISWINVAGITKFALRTDKDISGTACGGSPVTNYNEVTFNTYEKGVGYRPYITVVYASGGSPTVTTNPATYITRTTAQLNGYVNADGGEADTVSFNYLPWYNAGWQDCIEFTINHSYVTSDLTNFPVLVTGAQLNTTDPDFWTTVNSTGSDILFTDVNKVKLNRELVSINTTAKTMECYVNVTSVSSTTDTKFYMYYNSANISLYNESNSTATWDANYIAVWHMNDTNTSSITDSTVNHYIGTKNGAGTPAESTGVFNGDKAQSYVYGNSIAHTLDMGYTTDTTTEIYAKATQNVSSDIVFVSHYNLKYYSASSGRLFTQRFDNSGGYTKSIGTYADDVWFFASGLYDVGVGTNCTQDGYFNNVNIGQTARTKISNADAGGYIGNTLNGSITEVRVSDIRRATASLSATYYSMTSPASFAPVTDVFTTTATQSKNTGDSWYTSTTGLTANTLYGYKAEGVNSYGSAWGAWRFFDTTLTLLYPTNLSCSGGASYIDLSWLKGSNSSNTYIRYKIGSYPTTTADGNALPLQSSVYYKHTGLLAGTSYYYTLWGEDGGNYSTSYAQMMCTTTVASPTSVSTPLPTINTSDWHETPNGSVLENNPLYAVTNLEFDAISVPHSTGWMLVGLGGLIVVGLFIYTRSRNLLAALGAMIIFGVLMANMGLFPIWTMIVFGFIGIGFGWKELR